MKLKKTLAGILTAGMLLSPLKASDSNLNNFYDSRGGEENIEMTADYYSSILKKDDYLEEYRDDLKKPTDFWKKVFTTDSSKGFIVNPYNLNHWTRDRSEIEGKRYRDYWVFCGKKQFMKRSIKRFYEHADYTMDSLKKHDLPVSLSVVPLYESGFKEDAVSHAGAVGMWQFMEWTARYYGLEVNHKNDERLDPKKSLSAFIKYYEESKKELENPLFALVSFNVGRLPIFRYEWSKENPIKTIYSGIGFAPRNYPSMYFAAKDMLCEPEEYFPFIFQDKTLKKIRPKDAVINYNTKWHENLKKIKSD